MNENFLFNMLGGEDCAAFVVSSDQTILYWSKGAERVLGYRAADVVGRRCYDIANNLGGGLTQECLGGCPSIRYLRAGLVPAQCQMRMYSLSGDRKWISVAPMVAAGLGSYNLLVYLLDESPEGRPAVSNEAAGMPDVQQGQRPSRGERSASNASGDDPVLTQRELEILELVAQGRETPHIAVELGISQHTVRNHIRNLRHKLNATTKLEAVVTGIRTGVLLVTPH